MSVIVKGIGMPENCDVCRFSDWSNLHQTTSCKLKDYEPCFGDFSKKFERYRSEICPLIEIPEGVRLIDAKELKKKILKWLPPDPCGIEERERPFETDICVSMLMEIDEAPTIFKEEQ